MARIDKTNDILYYILNTLANRQMLFEIETFKSFVMKSVAPKTGLYDLPSLRDYRSGINLVPMKNVGFCGGRDDGVVWSEMDTRSIEIQRSSCKSAINYQHLREK